MKNAAYFNWLTSIIFNKTSGEGCYKLLSSLFSRYFDVFLIERDVNRAEDGISLRDRYVQETGNAYPELSAKCTFLEMMVALAIRMENVMSNPEFGDRTYCWFWIMIENIGLYDMTDAYFGQDKVDIAINKVLNRDYAYDGSGGGLFILDHPRADLRKTELSYQKSWFCTQLLEG